MIIITFPSGFDWYKANWIFRQVVKDVAETFPQDFELKAALEQPEAIGGLSLKAMPHDKSLKIMHALKEVAEDTVRGRIRGWTQTKPEDDSGQVIYLRAIADLLDLARKELGEK
jgi:hypothetical protein